VSDCVSYGAVHFVVIIDGAVGVGNLGGQVFLYSSDDAFAVAIDSNRLQASGWYAGIHAVVVCQEHECRQYAKGFRSAGIRVILVSVDYALALPQVGICVNCPSTAAVLSRINAGITADNNVPPGYDVVA